MSVRPADSMVTAPRRDRQKAEFEAICGLLAADSVKVRSIPADASLAVAARALSRDGRGALLLIDSESRLQGMITDMWLRGVLSAGQSWNAKCQPQALQRGLVASVAHGNAAPVEHFAQHRVEHLLLVDANSRVVDFLSWHRTKGEMDNVSAIVMAGGSGSRLGQLTANVPKPMLPVSGRPLLERIVIQLREAGVRRISLAVHHAAEVIEEHFRSGSAGATGVEIVREQNPLGTAGAIALVADSKSDLIVVNGDILTRLDFRAMLQFHREQQADLTIASRNQEEILPFGVVDAEGFEVRSFSEKPVSRALVSAGVYILGPAVRRHVPQGRSDLPDVLRRSLSSEDKILHFPVFEYWLDIGETNRYRQAQLDFSVEFPNP